jgi:hypothetical protein
MDRVFRLLSLAQLHERWRNDDPYWECFYWHKKAVERYYFQATLELEELCTVGKYFGLLPPSRS